MKNYPDSTTCSENTIVCDWEDCPHYGNCTKPCTVTTKKTADQIKNIF